MSDDIVLVVEEREGKGSSASRCLRREGVIPGIVYNSKSETSCIQLDKHNFEQMLHHHKSEHLIIDIQIGKDKSKKVLLKDVQHHPVSGDVLHADFLEISMTEKMVFTVAIRVKGDPVGVTTGGGILEHMLREIEIECLPTDLVEAIDVDVSNLEIGHSLLVKDVEVDPKFTVITSGDVAVALVAAPKVVKDDEEEEGEAAEGEEAAEGAEPKAEASEEENK